MRDIRLIDWRYFLGSSARAGRLAPVVIGLACLLAGWALAAPAMAQTFASPLREKDGAQAVLDRAIEAMGGDERVRMARTLVVTGTSSRATLAGTVKSPTKTYFAYPMSVRSETVVGGAPVVLVSTQEGAAMISEEGAVELSESARHNIERTAMRNPFTLMKSRYGRMFTARQLGEVEVAGSMADLVEITVARNVTTVAIDRASGRLVQQSYQTVSELDDKPVTITVAYSDFRPLTQGGTYPHRARGTVGDRVLFETEVNTVEVDVPLDVSLFAVGLGQASVGGRTMQRH